MPWKATSADVQFTATGSDGSSRNLDCVERSPERLVSEGSLPRGPIQAGEVVSYTLTASVSHWTGGFLPIGPIAGAGGIVNGSAELRGMQLSCPMD